MENEQLLLEVCMIAAAVAGVEAFRAGRACNPAKDRNLLNIVDDLMPPSLRSAGVMLSLSSVWEEAWESARR